jgi:2-polyprenyl-6-methoxyphenol hydroxylase-like FAD-dependent oxidoreductase
MARLEVLVSGAGIAGCTLAYWLTCGGHSMTAVERSGTLRSSGSPVDVRGPAVDVVERMNIAPRLREASIRVVGMTFLDSAGRRIARVDLEALRSSIAPKDIEIARGDLARILRGASANDAEHIFGDSIEPLTQDGMGVDVSFERSRPRRFDLVIRADGLHSIVRRLAFGADSKFVRHAGLAQGIPMPDFDYTDLNRNKRVLETTFTGMGWRVAEFLAAARVASDMYFDSVARVDVKRGAGSP